MTIIPFSFRQLYIWTFPDQSTVKHNPDQGQDIWNMQNNSEKCDRSWRQGRHSSQNNLGGLSLSLSWPLTSLPALLQVWSLLMMSTCLVFYIYEQYFLSSKLQLRLKFFAVFLAGKKRFMNSCERVWIKFLQQVELFKCKNVIRGSMFEVLTGSCGQSCNERKCNNTLDRWPRRKVFFASPLIFPIFDFWFFQFLIKTSEVQ